MTAAIDVREAKSSDDRLAILAIAHRANAAPEALLYYQAVRLALPRRVTARWWLLSVDREPARGRDAIAQAFVHRGRDRMHGRFPLTADLHPFFHDAGRGKRLRMFRGHADLGEAQLWSSDYF